jgi:hypothetical protein
VATVSVIAFEHFAIVILKRNFPPIKSRRELLAFMGGDSHANLIWSEYLSWHCRLNPANRKESFRAWMKELPRDRCTHSEWSLVADVQADKKFPVGRIDKMTDYLARIGADDSTLDSLESLWIKYHSKD